jgi:hypothetical protein
MMEGRRWKIDGRRKMMDDRSRPSILYSLFSILARLIIMKIEEGG